MKKLGSQNSNCRLRECPLVAPVPFQSGRAPGSSACASLAYCNGDLVKSRGTSFICVKWNFPWILCKLGIYMLLCIMHDNIFRNREYKLLSRGIITRLLKPVPASQGQWLSSPELCCVFCTHKPLSALWLLFLEFYCKNHFRNLFTNNLDSNLI